MKYTLLRDVYLNLHDHERDHSVGHQLIHSVNADIVFAPMIQDRNRQSSHYVSHLLKGLREVANEAHKAFEKLLKFKQLEIITRASPQWDALSARIPETGSNARSAGLSLMNA